MAAVLAVVVPILVTAVGQVLTDALATAVKQFQAKYPNQTVFEVFAQAVSKWAADNHIIDRIVQKLNLASFIAKVSNFSTALIHWVHLDPAILFPRDFAAKWDTAKIALHLADKVPENVTPEVLKAADATRTNTFKEQPTGTILGIVSDKKVDVGPPPVQDGVVKVLTQMGDKDMATASTDKLLASDPKYLEGIPAEYHEPVAAATNKLSRTQTMASTTKAFKGIHDKNIAASALVASTPRRAFLASTTDVLSKPDAEKTFNSAVNSTIRLQNLAISLLQYVKGSGIYALDGDETTASRILKVQSHITAQGYNISLENLFGSMDEAVSDDSTTVYSPASYLVDILQFLRGHNRNPDLVPPKATDSGKPDNIAGTVLESLLRRRPDLGDLELTKENTETVLPYIDLANEVMESFIVHYSSYQNAPNGAKQSYIDAFNVGTQDSEELLSQPQNVDMRAYRELAASSYPASLPYHQPIDSQRTFLNFLKIPRVQLVDLFRARLPPLSDRAIAAAPGNLPAAPKGAKALDQYQRDLQHIALDRQVDCERLGLVQEEYLILTKEVFWPIEFFSLTEGIQVTLAEYRARINFRDTSQCWGYADSKALLSQDDDKRSGLQFVKQQLLPRGSIAYTDLIEIVQTTFVNPNYPSGRSKTILDSLQFSYRFLNTLVDSGSTSQNKKYDRLADFLVRSKKLFRLGTLLQDTIDTPPNQVPRKNAVKTPKIKDKELKAWVLSHFESAGKIIVLDDGQAPRLEVTGRVVASVSTGTPDSSAAALTNVGTLTPEGKIVDAKGAEVQSGVIGILGADGGIVDGKGQTIARVQINGAVVYGNPIDNNDLNKKFQSLRFFLYPIVSDNHLWTISDGVLKYTSESPSEVHVVEWVLEEGLGGTASIDDVRLIHLNGDPLSLDEWDRLHRFIRVWRKLGWSVHETDRALNSLYTFSQAELGKSNLGAVGPQPNGDLKPDDYSQLITFDDFTDTISSDAPASIPSPVDTAPSDINPAVITELAAIVQILALTGLSQEQLLTFWTTMSAQTPKSLFCRLFFTRNARSVDPAFAPDVNGDYFSGPPQEVKKSQTAIMAAMSLTETDLNYLLNLQLADPKDPKKMVQVVPTNLSLDTISILFRHVLFAKILGVKITDLAQIFEGFGNPFVKPSACLAVLTKWGKIKDASFPWEQLRYILDSVDTPSDPLAPTKADTLRISKTLHDGILGIQADNPYVEKAELATSDLIRAKTGMVFDSQLVTSLISLLEGSTKYAVAAPTVDDTAFPDAVKKLSEEGRIVYVPAVTGTSKDGEDSTVAQLQIKGILPKAIIDSLKAVIEPFLKPVASLPNGKAKKKEPEIPQVDPIQEAWEEAVEAATSQFTNLYYDAFIDIFPEQVRCGEIDGSARYLLAPDRAEPPPNTTTDTKPKTDDPAVTNGTTSADEESNDEDEDVESKTPTEKRLFFLRYFIPFLQKTLAHVFVIDTITDQTGFTSQNIAKTFLENIFTGDKSSQSAISYLLDTFGASPDVYQGYVSPPSSSNYTFFLPCAAGQTTPPADFTLGSKTLAFTLQSVGSVKRWTTKSISLKKNAIASIKIQSSDRDNLCWQFEGSSLVAVPEAWTGYLSPTTNDSYIFSIQGGDQPPPLLLNNQKLTFSREQSFPTVVWSTQGNALNATKNSTSTVSRGVPLDSSKLYTLSFSGFAASRLSWKTSAAARAKIPSNSLLPDVAGAQMYSLFEKLKKMALVTSNFSLSPDEILYFYRNPTAFAGLNFQRLRSFEQWERIYGYIKLRDSLPPKTDRSLLDLFSWATENPDAIHEEVAPQLAAVTLWQESQILQVLARVNFTEGTGQVFQNEIDLARLQGLVLFADNIGIEVPRLFAWATPLGTGTRDFSRYVDVANDIQKVARSCFDIDSWAEAVRPLNDILRENQKNALISYLLVQKDLIKQNNITDADGLFEFFLIDVQMTPLVETSRIKQAISTVQLYVQRCLLGLEESNGVPADALDQVQWDWMQKYRTWEANRKIFLYPENWIDPSLRDDKSAFYKELESELLQKDLNKDTVFAALRSYLYNVDSVASLQCIGLYVDLTDGSKMHVFGRTRTTPYLYYYNWYQPTESDGFWNGWEAMDIDIPSYTVTETGEVGNYVSPIVYNGRLILFIAQITPQTVPAQPNQAQTFQDKGSRPVVEAAPSQTWKIQMGYSEYRNGRWTARQTCSYAYIEPILTSDEYTILTRLLATSAFTAPQLAKLRGLIVDKRSTTIDSFKFIPALYQSPSAKDTDPALAVRLYMLSVRPGAVSMVTGSWTLNGSQFSWDNIPLSSAVYSLSTAPSDVASFSVKGAISGQPSTIYSFQAIDQQPAGSPAPSHTLTTKIYGASPYVESAETHNVEVALCSDANGPSIFLYDKVANAPTGPQPFYHRDIHRIVEAATTSDDAAVITSSLASIYSTPDQIKSAFGGVIDKTTNVPTGAFNERGTISSLYNWELGLHAPMAIIDRLYMSQQFEQALAVCAYIFNPIGPGPEKSTSRYWVFQPFKFTKAQTLEQFFMSFKPGQPNADILNWRLKPFQPHVIARGRPQAYMKWVVMKYISILIGWGDSLFRQNTLETIPLAIQMYVLASHIYGPRGQKYPRQRNVKAQTYNSLMSKFDDFSNALVVLEKAFPFAESTTLPVGKLPDDTGAHLANVFGSAGTLYFTIPDNPDLRALADTIDDRLFKIRHSQDINGAFRQLPLFEPPIDPRLLVLAAAQGLSISSVLQELNGPLPNCRFQYILQRAIELAGETKTLGAALLSNREKKDGSLLDALRAKQEVSTATSLMDMKKLAHNDSTQALAVLQYNRAAAVSRMTYYLKLVGDDLSAIPDIDRDFAELDAQIEVPVKQGGFPLTSYEREEGNKYGLAQALSITVGAIETASGILLALPTVQGNMEPLGCGATVVFGSENIGHAMGAVARGLQIGASNLDYQAQAAGRASGYQKAMQERTLAANSAGYEISSIDKQITGAKIRIDLANKEIELQQKAIDNANDVEQFLRSKYSNTELYTWLDGATKTLFYNTYSQAFSLAMKAQKAFIFERPQKSSITYIQSGYWDASRDGLLSGENLYSALKQLETAYMEERGHDFEITKTVSLRRIDPLQLIKLRETGSCDFDITEFMYDMDFPGQYLRRIKTVSITIPCLVGPYSSVNATLRLKSSRYRLNSTLTPQYEEVKSSGADPDARFADANVPISAIAASSAQNDSGVFELTFRDDNYLPFEGAGAISSWRLDLPPYAKFRQFDYDSISDVLIQIRYTSLNGGQDLQDKARAWVEKIVADKESSADLIAVFDVKNEFASGWSRLMKVAKDQADAGTSDDTKLRIDLANLNERLPIYTHRYAPDGIKASGATVLTDVVLASPPSLVWGSGEPSPFGNPTVVSGMQSYDNKTLDKALGSWTLQLKPGKEPVKKCFLLVKYTLVAGK